MEEGRGKNKKENCSRKNKWKAYLNKKCIHGNVHKGKESGDGTGEALN